MPMFHYYHGLSWSEKDGIFIKSLTVIGFSITIKPQTGEFYHDFPTKVLILVSESMCTDLFIYTLW